MRLPGVLWTQGCFKLSILRKKKKQTKMINASGSSIPNPTTDDKPKTLPTTPVSGPGFPTHNPAMQHHNLMKASPATPSPVAPSINSTGATPPASPKFPDPTKNLVRVANLNSDTVPGGSNNKDTIKPKRKFNLKMIIGVVALLFIVLGSGAGFYLSQQNQDLRQEATGAAISLGDGPDGKLTCRHESTINKDGKTFLPIECICDSKDGCVISQYRAQCSEIGNNKCSTSDNDYIITDIFSNKKDKIPYSNGTYTSLSYWTIYKNDLSEDSKCGRKSFSTVANGKQMIFNSMQHNQKKINCDSSGASIANKPHVCLKGSCIDASSSKGGDDQGYLDQYFSKEYSNLSSCNSACGAQAASSQTTTTTTTLQCNSTCTSTSQCPSGNSCLKYYDFGDGWNDVSGIADRDGLRPGTLTSWDAFAYNGDITHFVVKNGIVYSRSKINDSFTNVTSGGVDKYDSYGSGTITSVNGYVNKSGAVEQWMVRGGEIYHSPSSGAPFTNITSHVTGVGSGTITAYTVEKYIPEHSQIISAYLVQGGRVYHHTSSNWNKWNDITDTLDDNSGTGSGSPTSLGFLVFSDGRLTHHLVKGGKLWSRKATIPSNKKCRLPAYPNSTSCNPPGGETVIPPTTTPTYEYICNSKSSLGGCVQISSDNTLTFKEGVGPYPTQTQCTDACKPAPVIPVPVIAPKQVSCQQGCGPDNNNDTCDTSAGFICRVGACVLRKNPNSALCTPSAVASCGEGCGATNNYNTCTSGLTCTAGSCVLTSNPNSDNCTAPKQVSCQQGCGPDNNNNTCKTSIGQSCQLSTGTCVLTSNPNPDDCRPKGVVECKSKQLFTSAGVLVPEDGALLRGEEYQYRLTTKVTNKSDGNVVVSNVFPSQLTHNGPVAASDFYLATNPISNIFTANLGVLDDIEKTIRFSVNVPANADPATLLSTATISDTGGTPVECSTSHKIIAIGAANCVSNKAYNSKDEELPADNRINPNETFFYTITVSTIQTTTGPVVVTNKLPLGIEFVTDAKNTPGISENSGTVTADLGVLASGETKDITFKVKVVSNPTATEFHNEATVTTSGGSGEGIHTCSMPLKLYQEYSCNSECSSDSNCDDLGDGHTCYNTGEGKYCRLASNPQHISCDEEDSSTTTTSSDSTSTVTPTIGCNETCITSSDCSDSNHSCTTTEDGSLGCRLTTNPSSTSCTLAVDAATQPTLPPQLLQTGPEDWLNWFKAGLVTLGLGTALFFLL